jgi:hypothetical protein
MPIYLTKDLIMKWVAAKFMLRLLTEEQKNKHVNVCHNLQEDLRNDLQFLTKL